jgi:signal transduction histidine kinase
MRSLRRALVGLGLAGFFYGLAVGGLILGSDHVDARGVYAGVGLFIGWSFIGTGLFAWWRRPTNRFGALLASVGFAWITSGLYAANAPALFMLGFLLGNVWIVLFAQTLLAYPSGVLQTLGERKIMAAAWVSGLLLQIPPALFLGTPNDDFCEDCPRNLLLISDNETLVQVAFVVQGVVGVGALIGLVTVLIRRWKAASPAQRAALGNVLWLGVAAVVLFSLQLSLQVLKFAEGVADVLFLAGMLAVVAVPYGFLAGVLRTKFSRAEAVNELVERLGTTPAGETGLRDALADALDDPELSLAYWLPEQKRYVDAGGRPVSLPQIGSDRAVCPVERDGRPIAAVIHDAALSEHTDLVRTAGAAAALALENERLDAEVRARVEELRESRARIVQAADQERRRLERDLHDGAQQRLVALALTLRVARSKLDRDPEGTAALLEEAAEELGVATEELRELARGIHPAVLTDHGLGPALDALAGRVPVPVELKELPGDRLPTPVESAAYFVVSEALTNVSKYARATRAEVRVERTNGRVTVEVRDDGIGGADPTRGSGLRGLADRISALDGRLEVESDAGRGTTVRAVVPCE